MSIGMNQIHPFLIAANRINTDNCLRAGESFGKRTVRWFEAEFVSWGEGYILTNGRKLPARKGDIFFRTPGMSVEGVGPYHCHILVFDLFHDMGREQQYLLSHPFFGEIDQEAAAQTSALHDDAAFLRPDFPPVLQVQGTGRLYELFDSIYLEYINSGTSNQFILRAYLMQILLMLYQEFRAKNLSSRVNRSLKANYEKIMIVKKHMDEHVADRFSLDSLASLSGLSANFFCRVFKYIVGYSPIEYHQKNKVSLAKRLLIETNLSIKEISFECGFEKFENPSYFFNVFKKSEGVSPLVFREKHRFQ